MLLRGLIYTLLIFAEAFPYFLSLWIEPHINYQIIFRNILKLKGTIKCKTKQQYKEG